MEFDISCEGLSMSARQVIRFQEALEAVEALPDYQQEEVIDTIQRRRVERRREELAKNIEEAREEYARGEVKRGTVEELMKELSA